MPAPTPLARLIELLHEALRAQHHHAPDHPAALKAQAELEAFVPPLLQEYGKIRLEATGVGFTFGHAPVPGAPNAALALSRELDARDMGGLEFRPGLDPQDLRTLLFVLQLSPQRLAEMGGAATLLPRDGLLVAMPSNRSPRRKDSPLKADPVELDWDSVFVAPGPAKARATVPEAFPTPPPLTPEERPKAPPPPPPPPPSLSPAALRDGLSTLFHAALEGSTPVDRAGPRSPWGMEHRETLERFGFRIPGYGGMAGAGVMLKLDALDPGSVRDALRRALADLEPLDQGNVLLGLHACPPGETALRRALDFLAPEWMAQAVAHVHVAHRPSMFDLALLAVALMQTVPDRDLALEAIRGRLQFEGWGMQEVEEFKEAIHWECQGTDTKLHLSLEGHAIHKLDPHMIMILGRQLMRARRLEELRSMLEQLEEELASPQEALRRHGTEILANLADALPESGLPLELETRMLAAARDRLSAENDQLVAQWCAQTMEAVLSRWLFEGNFGPLHDEMRNLGELAYPSMGAAAWKPQLIRDLLARLGSAPNVAILVPLLFRRGAELPVAQVHAVLALMGAPAAAHLAASLELEEDPSHQVQLVEALRAVGKRAIPVLQDLLTSPQWHMVDHALMLLAQAEARAALPDMVQAIGHPDLRVRRTAVRAVSGLAGKAVAAKALAETLAGAGAEAQLDALNLLGDLADPAALPAIGKVLHPEKPGGGDEGQRLRLRAAEALGRIPGPGSVKHLQELFQKKGLFKTRESVALRLAGARALAALNSQEAREAMALAMEGEPADEVRGVLRQYLVR